MLCRLCFAIIVLCLGLPSQAHLHARARGAHVFHVGARTERLKLIRVYDRRIKCRCRVSREDRQLMCRTALYAPPSSRSQSLFQYSYLAKSRRSHGALSSRGDCCCAVRRETSRRECGIALFTRAFIIKVRAYSVIIEITCYKRKESNK